MLTNEEIIERYGNHPESKNYNDTFPTEYILCVNCPAEEACLADRNHIAYPADGKQGCYDRIRALCKAPSTPDPTADVPPEDKPDVEILYICDRRACAVCDPNCRTTRDIRHAKNFELKGRTMVEVERVVPPTYTV